MINTERKDCNVSLSNIKLEVEELEDLILQISTLEVALEKVVEDSHSNMLKTFSENSLEVEIHLLGSWMMMMISSSLISVQEVQRSNNLKRLTNMILLEALEVSEVLEDSKALLALENLDMALMMISLEEEVDSQEEVLQSKPQLSSKMERKSLKLRRLILIPTETRKLKLLKKL